MNTLNSTISAKTYVPIKTAGIERVRVDVNGNVGIGTTSPAATLDINGTMKVSTNQTNGSFKLGNSAILYKNSTNSLSIGKNALNTETSSGNNNIALGDNSLCNNTNGFNNTSLGVGSLTTTTTSSDTTSVGYNSLTIANDVSGCNTSIGSKSLSALTTGKSNVSIGYNAASQLITGTSNIYVGANITATNGATNEIVLAPNGIGNGSNTITIGNSSTTKTVLSATTGVGINTTTPAAMLDVNGTVKIGGTLDLSGYNIVNSAPIVFPYTSTNAGNVGYLNLCMPIEGIVMWSGTTVPQNWGLCNGSTYGTIVSPDLRDKFIYGASSLPAQRTGGSNTVTLTAANIPSHTHGISISGTTGQRTSGIVNGTIGNHSHTAQVFKKQRRGQSGGGNNQGGQSGQATTANSTVNVQKYDPGHTHTISIPSGTADSNNTTTSSFSIMPPYYILAFIIRIA